MLLSCTFTATLGIFFSVKKEQKDLHTHTHTLLIIQEEMNKTLCHTINWVLILTYGLVEKPRYSIYGKGLKLICIHFVKINIGNQKIQLGGQWSLERHTK